MKNRIYEVTFNEYSSALQESVYSKVHNRYEEVNDLLIFEKDFSYWQTFGEGFAALRYVGLLEDGLDNDDETDN